MARISSVEELRNDLDLLIGRRPPLVQHLERGPGQREDRYAHLLSGEVVASAVVPEPRTFAPAAPSELEQRVKALEEQVAELRAQLGALGK